MKLKLGALGALGIFLLAGFGCSTSKESLRQALNENPDILFQVIESHPEQFMASVKKASTQARQLSAQKEEQEMQAQLDGELKTPLKMEIPEGRAFRGKKDAPILIVEWSDFQCPFCGRGYQTVEAVRKKYGDKVGFLFRQLPLPFHPLAMPAAKRFEAIALQSADKAYRFHDEVFTHQDKLGAEGEKFLDAVAKKVGANVKKMKKDMESEAVLSRIKADQAEAAKLEFSGTPGFVVSGVRLKGAYPQPVFERIIDARLSGAPKTAEVPSHGPKS